MKKVAISVALLLSVISVQARKRPNVIYVFPDQLRNAAMGFWNDSTFRKQVPWRGDPTITPNINAFARQSVVFTSALSNCPVSSAHRGMLLTGLYPNKSGVSLNCHAQRPISDLRDDVLCLSDIFHNAGYQTAYIGKLHAHHPTPNNPQHPGTYVNNDTPCWDAYTPPERRHGFDFWYSYGTFDEHKNPHYWDNNGNIHQPHRYSPAHEAQVVVDYLNHIDPNRPFFIMVGMNPPHSPYRSLNDCEEQDYNLYKDIPLDSLLVRENINPDLEDKKACAPYYFANVTGVDRAFGQILDALRDLGLEDNTIVVFASDHGETMCSHVLDPKNTIYTESMNIPFIVRYPNKLKPAVSHNLLSAVDIMPTLVHLAGLGKALPDSLPGFNWARGINPQRSLTQPSKKAPKAVLYLQNVDGQKDEQGNVLSYHPSCRGVVTDRWSLCIAINKKQQIKQVLLFDNIADPYQTHPLRLSDYPNEVPVLLNQLEDLLRQADDPWITLHIWETILPHIR